MRFLNIAAAVLLCLVLMPCCGNKFDPPNAEGQKNGVYTDRQDVLKMIYAIAEEKGMKVICDLNMNGGELYRKYTPEYVAGQYKTYVQTFYNRYGRYKSFWGWYLNNELNPLGPGEKTITAFWHKVWKAAVQECKRVAPQSVVTISPFFLLDKNGYRGFEYLQPEDYEKWWAQTLLETGIDILMLQDSGAEHIGFFTLDDRRPFLQALKNACEKAGAQFWVNVETGEVVAKDWQEFLAMEKSNTRNWKFTPINWLQQKLELAAEYGSGIVNWGYFPFMNPVTERGPWPSAEVDGQTITSEGQRNAYDAYAGYYQKLNSRYSGPQNKKPAIRGTLWWLPVNYENVPGTDLENVIREQIEKQYQAGFDLLWIVNAPANMEYAMRIKE
ncbi:DUF4434 domain-containing protein [Niabella drilacis]|uniref:DUF4434 domain-containing protein n=1 Tax=Niabella drilacis (strain DSM 25811 / CCM 8410 / CCUG 62505 / LMG 26954 / E90) TaxID=1285928 RepID=A0A1G6M4R4_NIADE|nr:DUF4434 domain-containing protein [Niabella drilacis]SDC50421.1 protein of unknown function [Niabella drilacis]